MKADVLTLAALVFIVGLLASSIGSSGVFESTEEQVAPSALQQGVVKR
ncbi:MAG: hypothetical protein ACI9Y1_000325 [Lentisphaeria bacterium]|jgi:hypothetical protein